MRKAVKKSAEWIHATLIMAIIIPFIYSLGADQPNLTGQNLYFKCLVIVLPVIATDFAIKKCKGLFSYLIVCTVVFAVTASVGWAIAGRLHQSPQLWIYMITLMAETVFVIVDRMSQRIHQKKDEREMILEDSSWRPSFDGLRTPSFAVLIFFVLVYAFALNLNNPAVCNAALFSGAIYAVIAILHQYVCRTENYLFLNKGTGNIPSKRIYGIGNGMLAIFFLLFIIVLLPSLFTISSRNYHDLKKSSILNGSAHTDLMIDSVPKECADDPMLAFFEQLGEPKPTPKWVIILFHVIEITVLLVIAAVLIIIICDTFRAFRQAADENGDIVEELEETNETVKAKNTRINRRTLSERERVRKEYRKFIRHYRKERPAHYESPIEIETNAGIAESKECQEIHRYYELARYGQES